MKTTKIAKNLLADKICDTCDWYNDFYGCELYNDMGNKTCEKWDSIADLFKFEEVRPYNIY